MPRCQSCGKQWPEGYAACPDDGTLISPTLDSGALAVAVAMTSDDELPPGSHAGEYVIEQKLGEGGMGAIYGARHPVIGKRAAVKVIKRALSASAEAVDRFVREAQAVNTVRHPNIVDVFGFGSLQDGRSFFVMEWLEGESLRNRMLRPIALSESLEVLESIAIALQAAHEAGVVHRDLKPDNVFLARTKGSAAPHVKLLDFGLAKLQGGASDARIDHTRTGVVMGTPLYLSPEQAKGIKVDGASDIYSLGAIAYELGSGAVPFMAESAVEIMAKHISEAPPSLHARARWLPLELVRLVEQMLAKDPHARPTIDDVVARLAAMRADPAIANAKPGGTLVPQSGLAHTPVPASSLPPGKPSRRSHGLVIGIAAVVAVAAGITAFAILTRSPEQVAAAAPPEPVKPAPVKPAPVKPAPVKPAPAEPEPVKPAPAKPAPAESKPVTPRPVEHVNTLGVVAITISGAAHGDIYIDGKLVASGAARSSLELTPGQHRVRVVAPGHQPFDETIRVEAGARRSVAAVLKETSINEVHDPFTE